MGWSQILFIVESIIFWILVGIIAWWGPSAPPWAFAFLFYYLLYLVLRFIFSQGGMNRILYLNVLNIVVLLGLFVWYYRTH